MLASSRLGLPAAEAMGQVVVGTVRRAHGMKGQLLVHPETDDPEGVYRAGRLFAVPDAPEGLVSRLTLASAGWSARGWRLGFAEIGDREAAESYAGCTLEVDEQELAALEENEFFLHDLVGLDVQDAEGSVGRVDWVFDRPGQPVLVVVDDRGDRETERLIPFNAAIIRSVDIEAGIVRIDPPPGLLDL